MLTIKKGGRNFDRVKFIDFQSGATSSSSFRWHQRSAGTLLCALLISVFLVGCMDPGPRALLDGDRLLREGKVEAAIPRLEEAVSHLPQDPRAWNYLGLAMHRAGKADQAIQHYNKALGLDRNFAVARFNLGCLYLEQNDPARAMAELTTYVNLDPKKMEGWLKLGTSQLRQAGNLSTATERTKLIEAARKSLEYSLTFGSNAEAQNALGMIEVQRGKPRDAVRPLKAALQADPDHTGAMLNLAIVYQYYLNDPRSALPLYQAFLAAEPRSSRYREIEALARQLDAQLHPAVIVTNAPATTHATAPVTASTQTNTAGKPRESKTETLVPKPAASKPAEAVAPKPAPTKAVEVVSPRSAPSKPEPAPVPPAKVEVATVVEEPPVKAAQDQPVEIVTAPTPQVPREQPVKTAEAPPAAPDNSEKEPKKGLLQKINPTKWFRGKTNEPAPSVAVATNQSVTVLPKASPPKLAQPTPPPTFTRYRYLSPAKGASGNRSVAMVSFNDAMQAQRSGNMSRAMSSYRAAIKSDPGFFEAYHNFGLAAFQSGDLMASLHAYENALAISPDSSEARYNFGLALQRAKYPVDAANELEKVVANRPNDVRVHLTLGNLYAQQLMQPQKARHHYEQVVSLEPQHPQAGAVRHWLKSNP